MAERYLLATGRYIQMNQVAAKGNCHKIVKAIQHSEWDPLSSAQAHLKGKDNKLVNLAPVLQLILDWAESLQLSS